MASGRAALAVAMAALATGCTPEAAWVGHQLAGPASDEYLDVAVAGDVVLVAGYRDGTIGEENLEPAGNARAILAAFNSNGSGLWERSFDTDQADTLDAIIVGGTHVYGVGRTRGSFPGFQNAGQVDVFVVEVPLDGIGEGRLLQFGTEVPEHPVRIAVDVDGSLLIGGYDDIFVPSNYVDRWENTLTARVKTDGAALTLDWARHGTTAFSDLLFGIAPTGVAGEMFVGGLQGGPEDGPFVRRLAANGDVLWNVRLGNIGSDGVTALAVGADGKVYAAGGSFTQFGAQSFGQQDAFVVVLDPLTGTKLRAMQAGTEESEWPRDMVLTTGGEVYLTGGTAGGLPGYSFAGLQDGFVIRFGADGAWTSSWQVGGAGFDDPYAITLGERGTVYVAGWTEDALVPESEFGGVRDGFLSVIPAATFQQ